VADPRLWGVIGWAGDFFRFWWSLFYWNIRKTVFRWRGGRCPCQNPSDSGRALETGCDACTSWHRPARFRRVCPLLVSTPGGPRCSADTKEVRPFWGRALAFYSGGLAVLYLVVVLGIFSVLRGIGYPVHLTAVAWPPAWRQIQAARAEYFYEKAGAALATNHVSEALLGLSYAYNLNPRNHQAGLLLAKLWQMSQPALSDRVYARLLRDNPEQAAQIVHEWYRALLARGDFPRIAQLTPSFLRADAAHAPVWLHALFFAGRRLGDPEPLRRFLAGDRSLPSNLRRLAEIELLIETGHTSEAHSALLALAPASPYGSYYQVSGLTTLGFPDEALLALNRAAAGLPQPDYLALRLDAYAAKGWRSLVESETDFLLSVPSPAAINLLCAHFIRYPDAELLAAVFRKFQQQPLAPSAESYEAVTALFCSAGVNASWSNLHLARGMFEQIGLPSRNTLDIAEAFFHGRSAERRLGSILPLFQPPPYPISLPAKKAAAPPVVIEPMALDVTYALFEHYGGNRISPRAP